MMSVVVSIDGLRLKARNRIEFLDGGSTQPSESPKNCTFDLCDLSVLNCIHQGVLSFCCMVLKLLGRVFFTKRSDLVEIHLQIVRHLLGELVFRCVHCISLRQKQSHHCNKLHYAEHF